MAGRRPEQRSEASVRAPAGNAISKGGRQGVTGQDPAGAGQRGARAREDRDPRNTGAASLGISASRARREEGEETELGSEIRDRDEGGEHVYFGSSRRIPRGSDLE